MSNSVRPHRWQLTRLSCPWDSPGKNTGVGCHFLLQCMKVESQSEVAQSCPTLSNRMDCSLPGSSVHGIFQARVLEWGGITFSVYELHWQAQITFWDNLKTVLKTYIIKFPMKKFKQNVEFKQLWIEVAMKKRILYLLSLIL